MNGQTMAYLALGSGPRHHDVLGPAAVAQWTTIKSRLVAYSRDPDQADRAVTISGCLHKLTAALLQVKRLRAHHDELINLAEQSLPIPQFALDGIDIITDFEALLLQSRATLDRLTWFITTEFGPKTQRFKKLPNVLSSFVSKRSDAVELRKVLSTSSPWSDYLLAGVGDEALRDLVGHKHSLAEGVETCPSVVVVSPTKALAFDCEARLPRMQNPTPLLKVARESGQFLCYTVLNCLAIMTGGQVLDAAAYAPTWGLRTVVRTEFVVEEPENSALGERTLTLARRMTPGGFQPVTRNYRQDLWERAIDRRATSPEESAAVLTRYLTEHL